MKDTAELTRSLASLIGGSVVNALTPLRAGRAHTFRADVASPDRQQWLVKYFPKPSVHSQQEFASQTQLRGSIAITPNLITADAAQGLLVFEYVPDAVDLFDALRRVAEPTAVLRALGELTGRLIVATHHPPPITDGVAQREGAALQSSWPRVQAWAGLLGVAPTPDLGATVTHLVGHYTRPTLTSLTQGDPAPSNVLFTPDGRALLVDFEYGAQRHVLADLAQWSIRCPLPDVWFDVVATAVAQTLLAERVYRTRNDFNDDLAHQVSYAALYMFTWLPIEQTLSNDASWVGPWTVRQALLSSSARGARAATSVAGLEPLAQWMHQLNDALARAWPASGDGTPDWPTMLGTTRVS